MQRVRGRYMAVLRCFKITQIKEVIQDGTSCSSEKKKKCLDAATTATFSEYVGLEGNLELITK